MSPISDLFLCPKMKIRWWELPEFGIGKLVDGICDQLETQLLSEENIAHGSTDIVILQHSSRMEWDSVLVSIKYYTTITIYIASLRISVLQLHLLQEMTNWSLTNPIIFGLCLFLLQRKRKSRNFTVGNRKYLVDMDFTASYASELKMLMPNSPTKIKTSTKLFQLQHLWLQVLFQRVRNMFQHYDLISLSCLL